MELKTPAKEERADVLQKHGMLPNRQQTIYIRVYIQVYFDHQLISYEDRSVNP